MKFDVTLLRDIHTGEPPVDFSYGFLWWIILLIILAVIGYSVYRLLPLFAAIKRLNKIDLNNEQRRASRRLLREEEALSVLKANPEMDVPQLAEHMQVALSSAYLILSRMKRRGIVERDRRKGLWTFPNIRK